MTGECTGNVRSTPTPKLTLRTVKVSRMPEPCRRITTPWKSCTRERVPSMTLTLTLSVSPGRNAGMSSRRLAESSPSSVCMLCRFLAGATGHPRCGLVGGHRCRWMTPPPWQGRGVVTQGSSLPQPATVPEIERSVLAGQDGPVPVVEVGPLRVSPVAEQIGSALCGPPQPLVPAPALHLPVVARGQDGGHVQAAPAGRLGVDGVLEQPVLVALLDQALGVP